MTCIVQFVEHSTSSRSCTITTRQSTLRKTLIRPPTFKEASRWETTCQRPSIMKVFQWHSKAFKGDNHKSLTWGTSNIGLRQDLRAVEEDVFNELERVQHYGNIGIWSTCWSKIRLFWREQLYFDELYNIMQSLLYWKSLKIWISTSEEHRDIYLDAWQKPRVLARPISGQEWAASGREQVNSMPSKW